MAGFDYSRMQGTATRLMERFQQGSVYLVKQTATPGAEEWSDPTISETQHSLRATVRAVSLKFVDGTTVLASDLEVTCAVFAAEPEAGDPVLIDDVRYTLVKAMPIPAAGTRIAHRLIVRR